ncbi:EutN/CcmL family microcompartment protein [Calycomorphotria hydatis]|uniref:Ethanolamine utilization protein EutN n=1 Tax=Calycomorphotria hydatis TaxID=2528027 RepID=A0A517T3F2_9PLAN|nr:EutN/CcmL family microcompartment protein [Calycomorphotria hydatis]QDT62905.1 Ethanolamine utilization protein EutN [Calycomorphotria hydatis]
MFLARVTGNVVSTHKVSEMHGQKLLLVEPLRVQEDELSELKPTGRTFIAVDTVGVGVGETVFLVQGSSARYTPETKTLPIDAAIVGVVDRVNAHGQCIFSKSALPVAEEEETEEEIEEDEFIGSDEEE